MTYVSKEERQHAKSPIDIFSRAVGLVRALASEARDRQKLRAALGSLPARNLRDIGLTASDVAALDDLPPLTNSTERLSRTRKDRSGNW